MSCVKFRDINFLLVCAILFLCSANAAAQQDAAVMHKRNIRLTLDEVISTAREQSVPALRAKHQFVVSYWRYRTYKAQFLPSLNLTADLGQYNRSLIAVQNSETGKINYVDNNNLKNSLTLSIDQAIPFTGGSVSIYSSLSRLDQFSPDDYITYNTQPINIYYNQPIKAFNSLKWEKKIAPKEFELAKKNYLETLENITSLVTTYFFDLLMAQGKLEMAQKSKMNNEKLYETSKERLKLGTIEQNDLLQLELRLLNDNLDVSNAEHDLRVKMMRLRTYLGYNENVDLDLMVPDIERNMFLDYEDVISKVYANSSFDLSNTIADLEAQKNIAQAKASNGLQASLFARFGLTKVGDKLSQAYKNPMDQEVVGLSLSLPIMDWGLGKGKVKVAKSEYQVVESQRLQDEQELRENIILDVLQFNLQSERCRISAKADSVGKMRYESARERFLSGTINVTELNTAQSEMDQATTSYLQSLGDYWSYYYKIRKQSLYDYVKGSVIDEDFEKMVGEKIEKDDKDER